MSQRTCKENIDYKILHNTGKRVIKLEVMSTVLDRVIVREASCVEDIEDFLESNVLNEIDDIDELQDLISKLAEIRHVHAELKCYLDKEKYDKDYKKSTVHSVSMRNFTKEAKEKIKVLKITNTLDLCDKLDIITS